MKIAMTVANDGRNDSRVVRAAEALSAQGHDVSVFGRSLDGSIITDNNNGVVYKLAPFPEKYISFGLAVSYFMFHARVILSWLFNRRSFGDTLELAWMLLIFVSVSLALLPLFLILIPFILVLHPFISTYKKTGDDVDNDSQEPRRPTTIDVIYGILTRPFLAYLRPFIVMNKFAVVMRGIMASEHFDVVHSHDYNTISAGMYYSARFGARLIYDAHEYETQTLARRNRSCWSRYWLYVYEKFISRRTDAVVTVSNTIALILKKTYSIPKTVVVANAPPVKHEEIFNSSNTTCETVRNKTKLPKDVPLAIYVGKLTMGRGVELSVKTLLHFKELHLVTVGHHAPEYPEQTAALARATGVEERLHMLEPVPPSGVVSFIRDADISFVLIEKCCLSYYYSFPNKLLESVFAGLPIIASDMYDIGRFVRKYGVGIVLEETSPEKIADAAKKIISEPERYRPSQNTMSKIFEEYGWPAQRKRLLELYESFSNA